MSHSSALEIEANVEKGEFPVTSTRVASVEAVGKYVDALPQGGFSSHEGLIALKKPGQEAIQIMKASETAYAQLEADGMVSFASEYQVPYTGADSADRLNPRVAHNETLLEYNEAAIKKGLKQLDYENIDDDQKAALKEIGFSGTDINGLGLLNEKASLTVSTAWDAEKAVPENIGTYSSVVVPSGSLEAECVAFTDHQGNEVIAPKTETLSQLFDSLGYTMLEAPTFDTVTPFALQPNEFNDAGAKAKNDKIRAFVNAIPSDSLRQRAA